MPAGYGAAGEGLVDGVADQHPTQRHVTRVHPLREHEEVGGNAVMLDREPGPGASEADEDLVGDEHDAMTSAQVPDSA